MRPGSAGYGAPMAEIRENQRVDQEFHEETPQEFAAEPDRAFSKMPPPGSDEPNPGSGEPEGDAAEKARDKPATGDDE